MGMPTVLDTVGLFWAVWGGERIGTGVGVIGCGPVCGLGARLGGGGRGDSGTISSSGPRGSAGTGGGDSGEKNSLSGPGLAWSMEGRLRRPSAGSLVGGGVAALVQGPMMKDERVSSP